MIQFKKLLEKDLDFFLKIYRTDISNLTYNDKIIKAEELFGKLVRHPLSLYPYPVIDLYISSKVNSNKQQYTIKDLSDLSDNKKRRICKIIVFKCK